MLPGLAISCSDFVAYRRGHEKHGVKAYSPTQYNGANPLCTESLFIILASIVQALDQQQSSGYLSTFVCLA